MASIDATLAANLHGAADQQAARIGLQFEKLEAQLRATELEHLREQLGDDRFQAAYDDAQHRSHDDLIAQAAETSSEPATNQPGHGSAGVHKKAQHVPMSDDQRVV